MRRARMSQWRRSSRSPTVSPPARCPPARCPLTARCPPAHFPLTARPLTARCPPAHYPLPDASPARGPMRHPPAARCVTRPRPDPPGAVLPDHMFRFRCGVQRRASRCECLAAEIEGSLRGQVGRSQPGRSQPGRSQPGRGQVGRSRTGRSQATTQPPGRIRPDHMFRFRCGRGRSPHTGVQGHAR